MAISASQSQNNVAGSAKEPPPAQVLKKPALGSVAQATPARKSLQAPEVVSINRPGTFKMKMTGTVGFLPGHSTPQPSAVSGNTTSRTPLGNDLQKTPVVHTSSNAKHNSEQHGDHLSTPVTSTCSSHSPIVASRADSQTPSTPANSLRMPPSQTMAMMQVPPRRRQGRPRKDGSNTRSALPSPSDAQRHTATLSGRPYDHWQSKPFPCTYLPCLCDSAC